MYIMTNRLLGKYPIVSFRFSVPILSEKNPTFVQAAVSGLSEDLATFPLRCPRRKIVCGAKLNGTEGNPSP